MVAARRNMVEALEVGHLRPVPGLRWWTTWFPRLAPWASVFRPSGLIRQVWRQSSCDTVMLPDIGVGELAAGAPLGRLRRIGHHFHQAPEEIVELRGRGRVPGLIDVVGRAMIPLGVPMAVDLLCGRSLLVAENKPRGRHADLHKAVVVGARKQP